MAFLKYFVLLLPFAIMCASDRDKRGLVFLDTSLYGTFLAIAVPLDIPDKNVFVSYNFEANYATVTNITEIDQVVFPNLPVLSSRHSRSLTRELAYTVLESRFKEHGMNGKECMLRNICEAAEAPVHDNGLLGHILHILFTPSASKEEGLDDAYYQAEADGTRGNCEKYLADCPYSLFDIMTRLVEIRHGKAVQ
ncbi:DM4/DM12 family domain-containing protein [Phthorimaea operculella]|nr:DM4/DM12 family domain-containing protein [Phthorimaea operculella]